MARDTSTDSKDKYHAGSTKWGKYKKKEKEAKKRRGPTSHNNGPEKQLTEEPKVKTNLNQSVAPEKANKSSAKENFDFPDGGWVCSQCQNYNF